MNTFLAELVKARTTRLLFWYAVGLAAFLTLVVSIHVATGQRFDLEQASSQRSLFAASGLVAVLAVLIGIVLLASEYNHGTINQSFLAVPNRLRLLLAKLVAAHGNTTSDTLAAWAAVGVGLVYAVVLFIVGTLVVLGSDAPTAGD